MQLPRMIRLRQRFEDDRIADPRARAREAAAELLVGAPIRPGQTVAVTGSSRGIANIADIIAGAVAAMKEAGLEAFVVPAMGSHGGGTAERQLNVLHHYGITDDYVGCPVRSQIEAGADHILLVNRIKPHTHLIGPSESGCAKILLIGLGKPAGAASYHRAFARFGFAQVFRSAVPVLLERLSVLGGLAIVENALDETCRIEALRGSEILDREPALLEEAKRRMPKIPVDDMHILIIDEMGKDISGTGMDPNVMGRDRPGPRSEVIFVRDLTPASEGNASGIGLADVTVRRLMDKMDWKATFLNCATALHPHLARVPYAFPTDREALEAALGSISVTSPDETRIVWIRNTLALTELEVSEVVLLELAARPDLDLLGAPHPIAFGPDGALIDVFDPPIA